MESSPPLFVDSHCHIPMLSQAGSEAGIETILSNARNNGVSHFLCVSVDLDTFPEVLRLAEAHDNVYASVGVHPNTECAVETGIDELTRLAIHPKVIAIGETGLDYYRSQGDVDWQRQRFRTHIRAARACCKPIIVHTRDARADTLAVMREENACEVGGIMHCFTEDIDTALQAMEMNFLISFSGIVTFRNAVPLQDVAREVPLDRMLVETDSPYLAPMPHRGHENQPAYVRHVGEFIARLKGVSLEEVAFRTTTNFFRLFPACRQ